MFRRLEEKTMDGGRVSREEALAIAAVSGGDVFDLFSAANRLRSHFRGDHVDICSIISARSGACSEDCAYCAQSASSSADIRKFPLMERTAVLEKAGEAKAAGAKRFCIVTSGRKASTADLSAIAGMISGVRALGLLPCATLGLLSTEEILLLKEAGLERFHHNVETSERYFPSICSTHTYAEKMRTIGSVLSAGLSLCSGGIFGLGERWEDRVDMAIALRETGPDSIPINFLIPIKGTRLGSRKPLEPREALKIISLYRFIFPDKEVRVCGGRMQTLGELHPFVFFAGADGLLSGDYLTTTGRRFEDDLRLISESGLRYR